MSRGGKEREKLGREEGEGEGGGEGRGREREGEVRGGRGRGGGRGGRGRGRGRGRGGGVLPHCSLRSSWVLLSMEELRSSAELKIAFI